MTTSPVSLSPDPIWQEIKDVLEGRKRVPPKYREWALERLQQPATPLLG